MASGGAGAPPASPASSAPAKKYVGSIVATVYGETPAAGAFFLSLFPEQEITPSTPNPVGLGKLSDPDVFYYYDKSHEDSRPEAERHSFSIYFSSSPESIFLGAMEIVVISPTHLYLDLIEVMQYRTGLGKKLMAILEDIALRKEMKLITLKSLPNRVSYYLGLNTPYTIAENANGSKRIKFNQVFAERKTAGNTNEDASTAASESIAGKDEHVGMMKVRPRKSRKNRKHLK